MSDFSSWTVGIAVAIGVVVIILTWKKLQYWFTRQLVCAGGKIPGEMVPPIQEIIEHPDQMKYELKDVHVPVFYGRFFKFFVWLSFTRFGRLALLPWFLAKAGLLRMGSLYIPEHPTMFPNPRTPPMENDHSKDNRKLITKLVEQVVGGAKGEGFHFPTVADFVRMYRSGVCTPTDIAETILKAIADLDKNDPPLRAIVQTDRSVVLAMAEASTQRWKEGKTLSVLDGIPVSVKGEFRVEPYAFRSGAVFVPKIASYVPDCVAVQKLKEAGAVVIGIANLQEFGSGTLGSNPNKDHLTARNPYNPQCYPGGSSSGSAVSVAAGLCPISLGTDGGGSVRIPAAICGVVGVKPTFSLLDPTGVLPLSYSVGSAGPLCSSVLDSAIALNVMCKETDGDKNPLSLEGLGETSLNGMNIGVYWEFFEHADPEIVQKCKTAVSKMESLGANIVEIKIPELEQVRIAHAISILSEFCTSLAKDTDIHFDQINLESLYVLAAGYNFSAVHYLNSQKQRTRLIAVLKDIFTKKKIDAIVTPATACPAPLINPAAIQLGCSDAENTTKLMRYAFLANMAGIPGLVLPVGYTRAGLPIGLQLMGAWYQEHTLLKIGLALEKTGDFPLKKPQVFYDLFDMAKQ